METLNSPLRETEIKNIIQEKFAIRKIYEETYLRYQEFLRRCPDEGITIELGSGGGFVRDYIPDMITSDIISYKNVDQVIDATRMPFQEASLRAICMLNVFHHISEIDKFFLEAIRCLAPGGRILIIDHYISWVSWPVFKFLHHEPFNPNAENWSFPSSGPLSGANSALAWIVFQRDRQVFNQLYPQLRIHKIKPHTSFRYWLAGGLKKWSLLGKWTFPIVTFLEKKLEKWFPTLGSFVDIEIEKIT